MRRRLLLLGLLVAGAALAYHADLHEQLDVESLRHLVQRAGLWGPVLFVLLFGLEGVGVPGVLFMLTAVAVWPPWLAFLCNWAGAVMAGIVGFTYARTLGRDWIAAHLPARVRRFERHVVERGLTTVILMRLALFLAPPAHWALGLSPVSFRTFVLGSAIGFAPGMLFISLAGGPVLAWFATRSRETWAQIAAAAVLALAAALVWRRLRRTPVPTD